MTDAPKPPAGWYPSPDGSQHYWDGEQWLALPPPVGEPATQQQAVTPKKRRGWIIGGIVAAVVVIVLGVGGTVVALNLAAAAEAAEAAAEKAAEQKRSQERREQQAADAERKQRKESVEEIEASIRTMAEEHVADEIIEGPILEVLCSPLGGGSTDDLSEKTTVFECFVANEDNGDGTMSGYTYSATMNWDTGQYTYGIGAP